MVESNPKWLISTLAGDRGARPFGSIIGSVYQSHLIILLEYQMKRTSFFICCLSAVLLSAISPALYSQQASDSDRRLKVYVGEIKGEEDIVKPVRDRLVDELAKRGVALSPSEDESDVILLGTGVHRVGTRFVIRSRTTVLIVIRGDIQLSARSGKKLWTSEVSSARWAISEPGSFAQIAASRVAPVLHKLRSSILAAPSSR